MPVPRGHVLLVFLEMVPPFNSGETAALPIERAACLVKAGRARYVDPPAGVDAAGTPKDVKSEGVPDGVKHKGGGYFFIGFKDDDGNDIIVKGKKAAVKAHEALVAEAVKSKKDPDPDPNDEGGGDPPDPEGDGGEGENPED